jgi:hypothetical protein
MERCTTFSGQNKSSVPPDRKQSEKLPGFCADALVVSRENIQFLVVRLQSGTDAKSKKPVAKLFFLPLQPFRACPQSFLPLIETKGKNGFHA